MQYENLDDESVPFIIEGRDYEPYPHHRYGSVPIGSPISLGKTNKNEDEERAEIFK